MTDPVTNDVANDVPATEPNPGPPPGEEKVERKRKPVYPKIPQGGFTSAELPDDYDFEVYAKPKESQFASAVPFLQWKLNEAEAAHQARISPIKERLNLLSIFVGHEDLYHTVIKFAKIAAKLVADMASTEGIGQMFVEQTMKAARDNMMTVLKTLSPPEGKSAEEFAAQQAELVDLLIQTPELDEEEEVK